jgi:hypothetical protein
MIGRLYTHRPARPDARAASPDARVRQCRLAG